MKIWRLRADVNNFDSFIFASDDESNKFSEYDFDGNSIGSKWVELSVDVYEKKYKGDSPGLPGVIVFNTYSIKKLNDFLENNVELLPINSQRKDDKYYIGNIVKILDCIDYENAIVKKFPNSDKVMRFIKYAFKKEIVMNEHIFKIVELPKSYIFVSDKFKDRVTDEGLKGFLFEEVWDSNFTNRK